MAEDKQVGNEMIEKLDYIISKYEKEISALQLQVKYLAVENCDLRELLLIPIPELSETKVI